MDITHTYSSFSPSETEKQVQYENPTTKSNNQLLKEANIKTNAEYRKYLVKNAIGIVKYNQPKLI